jgi:hypothetical protein
MSWDSWSLTAGVVFAIVAYIAIGAARSEYVARFQDARRYGNIGCTTGLIAVVSIFVGLGHLAYRCLSAMVA